MQQRYTNRQVGTSNILNMGDRATTNYNDPTETIHNDANEQGGRNTGCNT